VRAEGSAITTRPQDERGGSKQKAIDPLKAERGKLAAIPTRGGGRRLSRRSVTLRLQKSGPRCSLDSAQHRDLKNSSEVIAQETQGGLMSAGAGLVLARGPNLSNVDGSSLGPREKPYGTFGTSGPEQADKEARAIWR